MEHKPTEHQELKIAEALAVLETENRALFIGSAGTGKTFVLEELIKRLKGTRHSRGYVVCAAPTHKALKVLKDKISTKVQFSTVHSLLKYQKVTDTESGDISFKPNFDSKYPPLKGVTLLLIDEASMLPLEMMFYLEQFGKNCTIIFIGDSKQINPVGEEESPAFYGCPKLFETSEEAFQYTYSNNPSEERLIEIYCPEYQNKWVGFTPYATIELTEIVRQGPGNPIIQLSRNLDSIWEYTKRITPENKGFLYTANEAKIIEELALVNGTDEFKYLAWSNPEVDRVNLLVRKRIYGPVPAKIEQGETIVFDVPYGDKYTINQELKVEKLDIDIVDFTVPMENKNKVVTAQHRIKVYIINGHQTDDWGDGKLTWKGIFVIHEESEKYFKYVVSLMYKNCSKKLLDYVTRNKFLSKFAQFKYNHAITIHKSQGSTYKNVILNVGNVSYNPSIKEKERLFYTGVTRASDLLILYNVLEK